MSALRTSLALFIGSLLAACAQLPPGEPQAPPAAPLRRAAAESKAQDVVIFALGLLETGYRFGGKNPEAGLDCSGMVSYVFGHAAGIMLSGSAADIARHGKAVSRTALQPGDLVFFNTRERAHSHVGIYLGEDRFIHAPNSRGKVRTDSLASGWYAKRFEEGRNYFD